MHIPFVLTALFYAAIRRDSVSLLKFPFLSHVQVIMRGCHVRSCLLVVSNVQLYFPFLFPSYCHSVVYRLVSIVSDGCNQSFFVFFDVVFESSCRCINAVLNAGKFSSSLFS